MAEDLTRILDRIAHLKALEERPGTPEEAAAATAMIQKIMFRYNLDQVQVDNAKRRASGVYGRSMVDLGSIAGWRKTLLSGVCHFNFAKCVGHGQFSPLMSIVGQAHNIKVVLGMYDYLQSTIERLAKEDFEDQPSFIRGSATTHNFSFGEGATTGVLGRLQEQWEASMAEGNTETGLVLLDEELNAAYDDFFPDVYTADTESLTDMLVFSAGMKAGREINLAKQVEG